MTPIEKEIEGIVDGILEDYRHGRDIDKLLRIVYPGASRDKAYRIYNTKHNLSMLIEDVMYNLNKQIAIALRVDRTEQEAQEKAQELSLQFFRAIPGIRAIAQTDVEAPPPSARTRSSSAIPGCLPSRCTGWRMCCIC